MMKFTFSREVRIGELATAAAVIIGGVSVWTNLNQKVAQIEQSQTAQATATRELKDDFRSVTNEIKGDIRDLRREMRPRSAGQM
jgi:LmbE family N-acetylglucosaminyl deacetylase